MARGGWTGFLRIQDDGAAKTIGSIQTGLDKVTKSFKTGFVQNFNSFTLMKKGIDAVVDSAKELIKESREMVNTSAKFSIPINQLGELRNIAMQCGLGVNGLSGAIAGLHTSLLDGVVNPGGEASWTLEQLGIDQDKLQEISRRTGDAFYKVVDSLRSIKDATEQEIKTRAIFKGQYQEVMVLIKKSQDEQDEMQRKAHEYSEEQVKNNELAAKSWDDIAERLKGIAELLTPIMGMIAAGVNILVSSIEMLFEGLKMTVGTVFIWLKAALKGFVDDIEFFSALAKNGFKRMNPFNNYNKEDMDRDDAVALKKYEKRQQEAVKAGEENDRLAKRTVARVVKSIGNIQGALSDFGRQGRQFMVNVGAADDAKTAATEDMRYLREEEAMRKADMTKNFRELQQAREVEQIILNKEGPEAAAKYHANTIVPILKEGTKMQESLTEVQQKMQKVISDLKAVAPSAVWDSASQSFVEQKKEKGPAKGQVVESFQQMEIRLGQDKAVREQAIKEFTAGIDSWQKWSSGAAIAYKELEASRANLAQFLKEGDKNDVKKKLELINQVKNNEIKFQEKTRELRNLYEVAANESRLADINRKNTAIEQQQSRDLFGMKMRGVSAINQQNAIFRQAVDKIKREQAKYDDLAKDPFRAEQFKGGTGPAAIALKDSIQNLTFAAAKEMDTLMAMQFNYVSSDAAKKGMGGGIAMVNNPIDIAKESRDYLKKIYETIQGAGSFDVVPTYQKGVKGWNMGSNGILVAGRNITSEPLQ